MAAPSNSIDVLDHGFVRLDAVMADDLSVVNAARVSFGARVEEMDDRNAGLVRFLMRERHGTPFEHNFFRFHIKAPLFVTREWQRHRVGSFNERSGRYSELPDEFYVPAAGVAKEVARSVLPVGLYTEFYWSVNARSLMNFLSLRNAPTAQLEIRVYAEAAERHFEHAMPVTHAAFVAQGRTAP